MLKSNKNDIDVDLETMFDIDDETVQKSLESGMDLRECAAQIEKNLKSTQVLAIQDCINQVEKLADFHEQITSCDGILEVLLIIQINIYIIKIIKFLLS